MHGTNMSYRMHSARLLLQMVAGTHNLTTRQHTRCYNSTQHTTQHTIQLKRNTTTTQHKQNTTRHHATRQHHNIAQHTHTLRNANIPHNTPEAVFSIGQFWPTSILPDVSSDSLTYSGSCTVWPCEFFSKDSNPNLHQHQHRYDSLLTLLVLVLVLVFVFFPPSL
jgi:hypothetical protein